MTSSVGEEFLLHARDHEHTFTQSVRALLRPAHPPVLCQIRHGSTNVRVGSTIFGVRAPRVTSEGGAGGPASGDSGTVAAGGGGESGAGCGPEGKDVA